MSRSRDAVRRRALPLLLRLLGVAGTLVVVVLLPASPAAAHAVLVASQPANGTILAQSPRVVSLRFSEDISARFSTATLLDGNGRPVTGTRIAADRDGPRVLALELPALPADTYGVAWRVLADDDGHTTSGVVVFTVGGSPQSTAGPALLARATGAASSAPDFARRWLGLCLLAGLIGGLAFAAIVLRPVGVGTGEPVRAAVGNARRQVLALAAVAGGLACLVAVADLVAQAGRSGAASPSALVTLLADTRWGQLWVIRVSVLVALAELATALRSRGPDRRDAARWTYAGVLVAVAVTTEALGGHAASVGPARTAAVAAVAVHALTAFLWLGGVAALVLVLVARPVGSRDGRDGLLRVVRDRFTMLAVASVGLVIATGLYSAGREVGSVRALVDSSYGRILLVKSAVLVVVAGLGLANAVRRPGGAGQRRLLVAEVAAGVALLLAAGVLVETPPSREPATAAEATTGVSRTGSAQDVVVSLSVTPNRPGRNGFTVLAASGRRPPPAPIDGVTIEFAAGSGPLALQEIEPGRYFGTADLASPGVARATVVVRRGAAALTVPIEWSVPAAVAAPPRDGLAPIVNAMAIAVLGVLAFAIWRLVSLRRRRSVGLPATEIEQRTPEEVR